MRTRVIACGVVGGALTLIAAVVALITGGADTVIVGAWVTVAAAALGRSSSDHSPSGEHEGMPF